MGMVEEKAEGGATPPSAPILFNQISVGKKNPTRRGIFHR
jgi:hypothetical protein